MTARKRLVVASSCSLIGDVRVPRFVVQNGATFSGNVSTGPAAETAPKAAEPAESVLTASELFAPKVRNVAVVPDDGKVRLAGNKRKPNRRWRSRLMSSAIHASASKPGDARMSAGTPSARIRLAENAASKETSAVDVGRRDGVRSHLPLVDWNACLMDSQPVRAD